MLTFLKKIFRSNNEQPVIKTEASSTSKSVESVKKTSTPKPPTRKKRVNGNNKK